LQLLLFIIKNTLNICLLLLFFLIAFISFSFKLLLLKINYKLKIISLLTIISFMNSCLKIQIFIC